MVHALKEARRVVKPGGLVIDLRPGPVLRRVGITRNGEWKAMGLMHECLDDDHAADRAVRQVLREQLLKRVSRTEFDCERVIDTYEEFQTWVSEFIRPETLHRAKPVLERVARTLRLGDGKEQIVVHGPLRLQVLVKKQLIIHGKRRKRILASTDGLLSCFMPSSTQG